MRVKVLRLRLRLSVLGHRLRSGDPVAWRGLLRLRPRLRLWVLGLLLRLQGGREVLGLRLRLWVLGLLRLQGAEENFEHLAVGVREASLGRLREGLRLRARVGLATIDGLREGVGDGI